MGEAYSTVVVGERSAAETAAEVLRACGGRVAAIVEDDGGIDRCLALGPDLVVVCVARGGEMPAYRIGHEATAAGAAVIFVVPSIATPSAESLTGAVPGAIAVAPPLASAELAASVAEALAARNTDQRATTNG
jgi:hypothetical protein